MLTGYEQVRSIACALTGDAAGAAAVELTLPETGVCSSLPAGSALAGVEASGEAASCCGGPAPAEVDACCAQDAEAKAGGHEGCGCDDVTPSAPQLISLGTRPAGGSSSRCCG
jgi:hypothetical protein